MLNPVKLLSSPLLKVEWDNNVDDNLKPAYQGLTGATLSIRLFDLLKELGTVQPKRLKPSLMKSLMDYDYLLEMIDNTPDLKIRINDVKIHNGSELLTTASGDLGIGLSVIVMSQLFDIDKSTICKIIGTGRRPDWKCLLKDGRVMLVESKGSTSKSTSNRQLKDAVDQKNHYQGDVRVATAALLNENESSKMRIVDPPVIGAEDGGNKRRHIFRANHYASVFSFMGEEVLSLYFEKMSKRLSGRIRHIEMEDKELMFQELSYHAPYIEVDGVSYSGHLYSFEDNQYVFIGVDKRLLSFHGFMDYVGADEERLYENDGNRYIIYSDGILAVYVSNANAFFKENPIESVGLSYDNIALADLDSIRSSSFKRYVKYLLEKCYGEVNITDKGELSVNIGRQRKTFCIYHAQTRVNKNLPLYHLLKILDLMKSRTGVLVTNLWLSENTFDFKCIDREDFNRIAETRANRNTLAEVFSR